MNLTVRLLIFNVLLAVFPIGAVFFLSTYESQLLESQEKAMVQQGRILASALTQKNIPEQATGIFGKLQSRNDARLRIVNRQGVVLADSSNTTVKKSSDSTQQNNPDNITDRFIYRIGAWMARLHRQILNFFRLPAPGKNPAIYDTEEDYLQGPEILSAFEGKYSAFTRLSAGQKSVTLYSVIPLFNGDEINEVVLVSKSTYSILSDLYTLRLNFANIFLLSIAVAITLSILLARTVTVPIGKLKEQAEAIMDKRGKIHSPFHAFRGSDEVSQLSRALYQLSSRLQARTDHMETFTADLVHEMKNPIAGILSTCELATQSEDTPQRFLNVINREGHRIQRLLDDLQELIRIDVALDRNRLESINITQFIDNYLTDLPSNFNDIKINFINNLREEKYLKADPDKILQAISNLLDNAISFSSPGQTIEIITNTKNDTLLEIQVVDHGPGILPNLSDKIFERWYTDRTNENSVQHTGLGLAIVKKIIENYGGTAKACSPESGGAIFTIQLPLTNK